MRIKFVVDKRTVLMEVLEKLTNYFDKYPKLNVNYKLDYIKDVENYFFKYKKHKAVTLMQELIDNLSFNYDAPIALVLQINEDFTFEVNKLERYPFEDRLHKYKRIISFLTELKNFVNDTNFEAFYNNHKKQYNLWLKPVKSSVDDGLIDYLNTFYKEDLKRKYVINLLPLQTNANYGVSRGNTSYCNLGIKFYKDIPDRYYFYNENLLPLLHHEFSHPIVNPLVDKFFDESKMPKLPENVLNTLNKWAYGDYSTYVKEQIVRATDILFAKHIWGKRINEKERVEKEENNGFIHTKKLLKALKTYCKQSEPMKTYFPKILKVFY